MSMKKLIDQVLDCGLCGGKKTPFGAKKYGKMFGIAGKRPQAVPQHTFRLTQG
jgi:hypothetical protein